MKISHVVYEKNIIRVGELTTKGALLLNALALWRNGASATMPLPLGRGMAEEIPTMKK
jgi:hypothetical protein